MGKYPPLFNAHAIVKGYLAGAFLAGAIVGSFEMVFRAVLLLFSVLIFVDSSCAWGRARYILSFSLFLALGLVIGLILYLPGLVGTYIILNLIIMTLTYAIEYLGQRK